MKKLQKKDIPDSSTRPSRRQLATKLMNLNIIIQQPLPNTILSTDEEIGNLQPKETFIDTANARKASSIQNSLSSTMQPLATFYHSTHLVAWNS